MHPSLRRIHNRIQALFYENSLLKGVLICFLANLHQQDLPSGSLKPEEGNYPGTKKRVSRKDRQKFT